jgi:uncharacterized protein GlcG (DUF336 family)
MAYQKTILGLAEAQKAVELMVAEAMKAPDRPLSFAIADDHGDLVLFVRMDRCALLSQGVAKQKAYTSARIGAESGGFGKAISDRGWSVSDFGDANLLGIQGGVPIKDKDGVTIGGIGVSGRAASEDEEIAKIGLQAFAGL